MLAVAGVFVAGGYTIPWSGLRWLDALFVLGLGALSTVLVVLATRVRRTPRNAALLYAFFMMGSSMLVPEGSDRGATMLAKAAVIGVVVVVSIWVVCRSGNRATAE
jgi:hypothetical protein